LKLSTSMRELGAAPCLRLARTPCVGASCEPSRVPGASLPPAIGIVLVTSPARVHPATELIWTVLSSLMLIGSLDERDDCPVLIVCDGCHPPDTLDAAYAQRIAPAMTEDAYRFSKRGVVSATAAQAYGQFKQLLREEIIQRGLEKRVTVVEMSTHAGFAMSVRHGLRWMLERRYELALVMQHDRVFVRPLSRADLDLLTCRFADDEHCRYVGFPSGSSKLLPSRTVEQYGLGPLLAARSLHLRERLWLRPSIFWYDSNHLVHCARALQIWKPFRHAPPSLLKRIGPSALRRFILRGGDFIEDRFGVEQRNLLASLKAEPHACVEVFDWFGCYLVEEIVEGGEVAAARDVLDGAADAGSSVDGALVDQLGRATFVAHIDGRGAKLRAWSEAMPTDFGERCV